MDEMSVGIRELKSRLGEYIRRVKAGETVVITERGRPVGRIVPLAQPLQDRLQAMVEAGLIQWSGQRLLPMPPVVRATGTRNVSDLLVEDRA